jgi:N-succinyldiaminopimelate aminotransferase
VLNTPHNPTGKVFERAELEAIAELCIAHNLFVISDEVYEHLTYDGAEHIPIASLPGMRERTLTISSAGKTFSFTGWKIGWATGPTSMIAAAQAAHQFVTFATATPLQVGVANTLRTTDQQFYAELAAAYRARRDLLIDVLKEVGFEVAVPKGAYFIIADYTRLHPGDDRAFARHLVENYGVAAIPPSPFYAANVEQGRKLIRFAFCKKEETLLAAAERLRRLR